MRNTAILAQRKRASTSGELAVDKNYKSNFNIRGGDLTYAFYVRVTNMLPEILEKPIPRVISRNLVIYYGVNDWF